MLASHIRVEGQNFQFKNVKLQLLNAVFLTHVHMAIKHLVCWQHTVPCRLYLYSWLLHDSSSEMSLQAYWLTVAFQRLSKPLEVCIGAFSSHTTHHCIQKHFFLIPRLSLFELIWNDPNVYVSSTNNITNTWNQIRYVPVCHQQKCQPTAYPLHLHIVTLIKITHV